MFHCLSNVIETKNTEFFLQLTRFRLSDYSSEVSIYTLQTSLAVHRNMFRHKPRATLGLIFFTVLIQKFEKQ